jgi:hypothetical protein
MNRPRAHAGIRRQLRLSYSPSRGLQSQVVVDSADTGRRFRSDADRLPFGFRAGDAPKAYHAAIDGHVQQIRMRPRLRLQICQQSIANRRIGERILQLYWRARDHLNYRPETPLHRERSWLSSKLCPQPRPKRECVVDPDQEATEAKGFGHAPGTGRATPTLVQPRSGSQASRPLWHRDGLATKGSFLLG